LTLTDTQHIKINIPNLKFTSVRLRIDSPYFYFMDGTIPFIYKGEVRKWIAKKVTYDSAPFITGVPIGASSFVIQTVKKSSNQIILAKESTLAPHLHMAPTLL